MSMLGYIVSVQQVPFDLDLLYFCTSEPDIRLNFVFWKIYVILALVKYLRFFISESGQKLMGSFRVCHTITNSCDYCTEVLEILFEVLIGRKDEIHY